MAKVEATETGQLYLWDFDNRLMSFQFFPLKFIHNYCVLKISVGKNNIKRKTKVSPWLPDYAPEVTAATHLRHHPGILHTNEMCVLCVCDPQLSCLSSAHLLLLLSAQNPGLHVREEHVPSQILCLRRLLRRPGQLWGQSEPRKSKCKLARDFWEHFGFYDIHLPISLFTFFPPDWKWRCGALQIAINLQPWKYCHTLNLQSRKIAPKSEVAQAQPCAHSTIPEHPWHIIKSTWYYRQISQRERESLQKRRHTETEAWGGLEES